MLSNSKISKIFGEFQENLNPDFMKFKNWGYKYIVHDSPSCQIHLCGIKKGGYSSWHYHNHRFNRFIVLEGKLQIIIKPKCDVDLLRKSVYLIGDKQDTRKFDIKPGVVHKFQALTNVQLLEVYYTVCSDKDIIRQDKGGVNYEKSV